MAKGVLIVDDALFMRVTLRRILEQAGIAVAGEAVNGEEAVRMYTEVSPSAVLLDITMPVMDGLEAARQILARDPHAMIVMCTALGQQDILKEAVTIGVRDYIVKPFQPDRVVESIRNVMQVTG